MSATSPGPGTANKKPKGGGDEPTLEVRLDQGRWNHLFWAAVLALLGGVYALIFSDMGVAGKGVYLFLAWAGLKLFEFVRTFIRPASLVVVGERSVKLPPRRFAAAMPMPITEVKNAYVIRRAVPFWRTGPVLVVETARRVFVYPRQWFSSDADQRRLAFALNRRLGRL